MSSIAARFAVRGGWPALYAANRPLIGLHPNLLHSGTTLVLPGVAAPVRYKVVAGDTLARIAAGLAVRGGWPALYAANRQAIGPDPDAIHPGIVLTVPRPAAPSPPTPGLPRQRQHPVPPPPPAGTRHHPRPAAKAAPKATGMPQWLTNLLLAVGLLILAAFLAELVLVLRRRRQQAAAQAIGRAVQVRKAQPSQGTGALRPGTQKARIVLADHERLVVTRDKRDDTVYVLRPPGEDPMAILRVARLVLPEGPYGELAETAQGARQLAHERGKGVTRRVNADVPASPGPLRAGGHSSPRPLRARGGRTARDLHIQGPGRTGGLGVR